eukprot:Sspe_Gene.90183::Locus_61794_Transcript_1_1_Confidence_1.000_Length_1526::g.90183::m.90183/K20069/NECAP1_2; adaptin ear-binding coat-associated protein 1/2
MASPNFEVEYTAFECEECNVYKIPPMASGGHKAADWQNSLIWTGKCKVLVKGDKATVRLVDEKGEVFAECPVHTGPNAQKCIDPVKDSSRYFVLRIEDRGRHAFIGLGFKERGEAFDFSVAITDHKRKAGVQQHAPVYTGPKQDFSLKDGETIKVNLGGKVKPAEKKDGERPASSGLPQPTGLGLAPPPSTGGRNRRASPSSMQGQGQTGGSPPPEPSNPTPGTRATGAPQGGWAGFGSSPTPDTGLFSNPTAAPPQENLFGTSPAPPASPSPVQDFFSGPPSSTSSPVQPDPFGAPASSSPPPTTSSMDPFAPQPAARSSPPPGMAFGSSPQSHSQQGWVQPAAQPPQQDPQGGPMDDLLVFEKPAAEANQQAASKVLDAFNFQCGPGAAHQPSHAVPTQKMQQWQPF